MKKTLILTLTALFAAIILAACASTGAASGDGKAAKKRGPQTEWTFDNAADKTAGWYMATSEFWQYTGQADLSWSDDMGDGMLKLDLDFSPVGNQTDWSAVKMAIDFPSVIKMNGIGSFTFDFYYDPAGMTKGGWQTQIFGNNGDFSGNNKIDIPFPIPASGETLENGFIKVPVTIKFEKKYMGFLPDIRFCIVGQGIDYIGPVYIDNIRFAPAE
jgi:hypothetical protein